jgi:hypothetical protein
MIVTSTPATVTVATPEQPHESTTSARVSTLVTAVAMATLVIGTSTPTKPHASEKRMHLKRLIRTTCTCIQTVNTCMLYIYIYNIRVITCVEKRREDDRCTRTSDM